MVLGGLVKVQSYFKGCLTEQNQSLTFRKWSLFLEIKVGFRKLEFVWKIRSCFRKSEFVFLKSEITQKKRGLLLDLGVSFTSPGCALSFELGFRGSP